MALPLREKIAPEPHVTIRLVPADDPTKAREIVLHTQVVSEASVHFYCRVSEPSFISQQNKKRRTGNSTKAFGTAMAKGAAASNLPILVEHVRDKEEMSVCHTVLAHIRDGHSVLPLNNVVNLVQVLLQAELWECHATAAACAKAIHDLYVELMRPKLLSDVTKAVVNVLPKSKLPQHVDTDKTVASAQGHIIMDICQLTSMVSVEVLSKYDCGKALVNIVCKRMWEMFGNSTAILQQPSLMSVFKVLPLGWFLEWLSSDQLSVDSENTLVVLVNVWLKHNYPKIWRHAPGSPLDLATEVTLTKISSCIRLRQLSMGFHSQVLRALPWYRPGLQLPKDHTAFRACLEAHRAAPSDPVIATAYGWNKPRATVYNWVTLTWSVTKAELTKMWNSPAYESTAQLASPNYFSGYIITPWMRFQDVDTDHSNSSKPVDANDATGNAKGGRQRVSGASRTARGSGAAVASRRGSKSSTTKKVLSVFFDIRLCDELAGLEVDHYMVKTADGTIASLPASSEELGARHTDMTKIHPMACAEISLVMDEDPDPVVVTATWAGDNLACGTDDVFGRVARTLDKDVFKLYLSGDSKLHFKATISNLT